MRELVACEPGWSNCCPHCMAPITDSKNRYEGEPVPGGQDAIDRGDIITNVKPLHIAEITLTCMNGCKFNVERTQRVHNHNFQIEWQGIVSS